jgi:hypothetical protein
MFMVDIGLNFFTAYVDEHTERMVAEMAKIRQNYLKGWFAIDFVAVIPYTYIVLWIEQGKDHSKEVTRRATRAPGTSSLIPPP